jgi:hypothetical protein
MGGEVVGFCFIFYLPYSFFWTVFVGQWVAMVLTSAVQQTLFAKNLSDTGHVQEFLSVHVSGNIIVKRTCSSFLKIVQDTARDKIHISTSLLSHKEFFLNMLLSPLLLAQYIVRTEEKVNKSNLKVFCKSCCIEELGEEEWLT